MNPYDMIYDLNDVVNGLTQQLEVAKASLSKWESVFGHLGTPDEVGNEWVTMSDRLEAAEKERDALRSLVVMRFDHDHPPQFTQGYDTHDLLEPVTAEHCRWFVAEIERLRAKIRRHADTIATLEESK